MQKLKKNWDITSNWQLIFPLLGIIGLLACGYFIASRIMPSTFEDVTYEYVFIYGVTLLLAFLFYKFCMWVFPRLITKWKIENRWEMIAIFIVFAITGSASARLSAPLLESLGIDKESMSAWLFWPLRLLIIFPIYQVLLVVMGWLFGQFEFFWAFEKKMLARFGLKL
ncbi:MAG: DUF6787 family protein [Nonlabens sp.]|uniref:DUF6787 family protein n=1 Tax=Nonlabens sp. TaxID=1888209 RepID=UPI003EF2753F